jgi:glycosyltransferase involved in cell wall biosynthesis
LLVPLAEVISRSIPAQFAPRQLLLDVSELVQRDSKSGIQRVVKSILQEWLTCSPGGFRVEPVYATTGQGYRYARSFTLGFLGCAPDILIDEPIEYNSGDIFLGLDLQPHVVPAQEEFYQQLRRHGVKVQFIVYDLLCVLMPENFIEGAKDMYSRWLEVVMQSDGVVCISKSVAKDVHDWYRQFAPERLRPFKISWFHLGADIKRSVPSQGLPVEASVVMKVIKEQTSFLMVGTIEPRKGYEQTFAAFEQLWSESRDVNLIIVAKEGWMVEDLVNKLRNHPESGKHLFWLEDVSDEFLEIIYQGAACLIASSNGEGFGLPLIEAAQHKLPIIARDIPVFREVAGDSAFYFDSSEPAILAKAIQDWLLLFEIGQHPSSESIRWQTWKESAAQLADAIGINTQVHENGINTMQSKT